MIYYNSRVEYYFSLQESCVHHVADRLVWNGSRPMVTMTGNDCVDWSALIERDGQPVLMLVLVLVLVVGFRTEIVKKEIVVVILVAAAGMGVVSPGESAVEMAVTGGKVRIPGGREVDIAADSG